MSHAFHFYSFVFPRFLVIYGVAPGGNQNEVELYANQVSQGYRYVCANA